MNMPIDLPKTPVFIQDSYNPKEVAILLNVSLNHVYELSKRETDPLPLRVETNKVNGCLCLRDELLAWMKRNTNYRH